MCSYLRQRSFVATLIVISGSALLAADKSTGNPLFDQSVAKSIDFLTQNMPTSGGEQSLAAYALFKAGQPMSSPPVAAGIAAAIQRANSGYQALGYDHIYVAGVDAMLLADTDEDAHFVQLQQIADYIQSAQHPSGFWTGVGETIGDTSMIQYAMLGLWAAQRARCTLSPEVVDRAALWHLKNAQADGGWSYRPGTTAGAFGGRTTHNMTMAGLGSLSITRLLLYGLKKKPGANEPEPEKEMKFGVLEKANDPGAAAQGTNDAYFPDYNAQASRDKIDGQIGRAILWNEARFTPVTPERNAIYYYYAIERGLAINQVERVAGQDWYSAYGNGLVSKQLADGSYDSVAGKVAATSFAVLYFMRSTKQILDKQYKGGVMSGGRDPASLFGQKKKKKELSSLDVLLAQMESQDLSKLDDIGAEDIVESINFGSREELIGQVDVLRKLLKDKDASKRQAAYYALGRTGDFSLVPEIIQGIRDPSVDVNVEAIQALRYISRKPGGFGLSLKPLEGAEAASDEKRVEVANSWRTKAYKTWMDWYKEVRPYDERGGLDEVELATQKR